MNTTLLRRHQLAGRMCPVSQEETMPKASKTLRNIILTIALGTSAALVAAAPAGAHGRGGAGSHSGGGFVNTIHPIVRSPIVNTIHPIVRGPIVNTIHPIIATPPIVRDHRIGAYGYRCSPYPYYGGCVGEGGLSYGTKPAQLPYGFQLPQGGQVRDHRS
jgi:hypothetical protein